MPRRLLSTVSPEFALAPYQSSRSGQRKVQFCMLTLRHERLLGVSDAEVIALYEAKDYCNESQVDELFKLYDVDCSGTLDRAELTQAMEGIGLVPTSERAKRLLDFFDDSQDGELQREEFASLMNHIWGGAVAVKFSDNLGELYGDETLAEHSLYMWLGRAVPSHYVLRALRNTWPGLVRHIAILRNTADNPTLSPELMEAFDETYEPSVSSAANPNTLSLTLALSPTLQPCP